MDENNVNINVENEEIKKSVYSAKFLMSKELFYDFSSVSYNRTKKIFFIFLFLITFSISFNLLVGNYDIVNGFAPLMSFFMFLLYFLTKRSIKINYERNLISAGKESTLNYELFGDKIVLYIDEFKREYFYHQITKLFETKNFILLHLQHNLYATVEKSNLNANADEVKAFLINKCTNVKKKKFTNCSNDKKWTLVLLIAIIVVSIVGMIVGSILKMNYTL